MRKLVSTATTMGVVQVSGGASPVVTVHAAKEVSRAVLKTGTTARRVVVPKTLAAPIRRGQQLGTVTVSQNDKVLATVALLADSSVPATAPAPTVSVAPSPTRSVEPGPSLWSRVSGLSNRVLVALASTL